MNIPHVYRKAIDGFIIPPRTFFQMFISASKGVFSLLEEPNRSAFIDKLDHGTINEGVISQATAGPIIMLSLFHDLQNPLFKENNFDPSEFLEGVGPALENFHNVSGALENQLHNMNFDKEDKNSDKEDGKEGDEASSETANDELSALGIPPIGGLGFLTPEGGKGLAKILNHDWMDDAKKDPESLAGQLSRMVTKELFQIHQVSSKTQFLLQNHSRNIKFKEGSCSVNNVALLSARAFLCRELEADPENLNAGPRYETYDADSQDGDTVDNNAGVAAQVEVLYDVTQEFIAEKPPTTLEEKDGKVEKTETETMQSTIVSVATLEGWLKGGPDGELRWRLALYRPPIEFPGIQQAY